MKKTNLSDQKFSANSVSLKECNIAIVVSEWNEEITLGLKEGAVNSLKEQGIKDSQLHIYSVPGSFELPCGAAMVLDANEKIDAVICLGCIIQGETRHFEFIAEAVSNGIMRIGLDYEVPVIFGVLTCNTFEQAKDRSGGKHGNKGVEAAITCLKMIQLQKKLK